MWLILLLQQFQIFLYKQNFLYKLKTSLEACFYDAILAIVVIKVRTKLKRTWLIGFPDYTILFSLLRRHWIQNRTKLKIKSQQKLSFTKRIGRKCRLIWTRTEQKTDHRWIIRKIKFRSSFNILVLVIC